MAGAVPPDGTYPLPSEEEAVLDRVGVFHPDNRRLVRETLRHVWAGRSEGLAEKFERPPSTNGNRAKGKGKR